MVRIRGGEEDRLQWRHGRSGLKGQRKEESQVEEIKWRTWRAKIYEVSESSLLLPNLSNCFCLPIF